MRKIVIGFLFATAAALAAAQPTPRYATLDANCKTDGSGNLNCTKIAAGTAFPTSTVNGIYSSNFSGPMQPQNRYVARNTMTKISAMYATPPSQLHILEFGDSVGGFHAEGVVSGLRDGLMQQPNTTGGLAAGITLGCQGVNPTGQTGSCINFDAGEFSGGAYLIDGSTYAYDYTRSPTGVYNMLPAGGCVIFPVNSGFQMANTLKLYYVQEPGAGTLQMWTNNNGAGFVLNSSVSAANASTVGAVMSASVTLAPYEIKACATGNPVRVFASRYLNTTINGVDVQIMTRSGLNLVSFNSTPSAIFTPWFADMAPDMVIFEMKEGIVEPDGSSFLSNVQAFMADWQAANPLIDFVMIGSYPVNPANTTPPNVVNDDVSQQMQNAVLAQLSAQGNFFYWDAYYPALSYAYEKQLGWINDVNNPHQVPVGAAAETNMFWQAMGFGNIINSAVISNVNNTYTAAQHVIAKSDISSDSSVAGTSDLVMKPQRFFIIMDQSNNIFAKLVATSNANAGSNILPAFQTSKSDNTAGPFVCATAADTVGISGNQSCSNQKRLNALTYQVGNSTTNSASGNTGINPSSGGLQIINAVGQVTYKLGSGFNGGDVMYTRFCQDVTGGRSLIYDATQYSGPIGAAQAASDCTMQAWVYNNSKMRAIGPPTADTGEVFGTDFQRNNITGYYSVASDFTTTSTSLVTITGLSWTLIPNTAQKVPIQCHLAYSQATAAVSFSLGVQSSTIAPNNFFSTGEIYTSASVVSAGTLPTLTTTTATNVVSGVPSATATVFKADLYGLLDNPSNASANQINIMVLTSNVSDAITIKAGSFCRIN